MSHTHPTVHQLVSFTQNSKLDIDQLCQQRRKILDFHEPAVDLELVNTFICTGQKVAERAANAGLVLLQERYLLLVLRTLLETGVDPLLPDYWRATCWNLIYKPLFSLRLFYRGQPDGMRKIHEIEYELSLSSDSLYK